MGDESHAIGTGVACESASGKVARATIPTVRTPTPTPTPDPAHFARAVTELGEKRPVVASRAIFNARGVKIVDKGVRVDSRLYERLSQHRLREPLAEALTVAPTVDAQRLSHLAAQVLGQNPILGALLPPGRLREHLLEEVSLLPLPRAVALQLTALEETRPDAWQHALRSMVIAGWLAGASDGGTRHDMRMMAAGGLLYDIGMLHLDPVLHRPQVELAAEQRRHLYTHPLVSEMLLERHQEYPSELLRAVLEHHESLDGSGYPRGIAGGAISRGGRILGLTKLVATLTAPGVAAAAQRLSVVLRMNRHRYDEVLSVLVERALPHEPVVVVPTAQDPLNGLQEVEQLLLGWPSAPLAELSPERREAVAVVQRQCAQVARVLARAGVGGEALAMLARETLDDVARAELALIAHEAVWQLRVVARQARRRIRASEAPLPPWMTAWLDKVDRLCARWLSDAAAVGAEAVPLA